MKETFTALWERLRRRLSPVPSKLRPVSNDVGTVFLGVAVVFFTRSVPSLDFEDIDIEILAVSILFCLVGVFLRLFYRQENAD